MNFFSRIKDLFLGAPRNDAAQEDFNAFQDALHTQEG